VERVLKTTGYVVLGGAALALVVLNVLAWTGGLVEDAEPEPAAAPQEQRASKRPPPQSQPEPQSIDRPQARRRPQPVTVTTLSITATRGDCWVEVRAGSSSGIVLYAATLATGDTVRFRRKRLWLRLGAASNVDVVLDGRPATIPPGTVELLLPA
jgi:uncharacterized protein DUF4115